MSEGMFGGAFGKPVFDMFRTPPIVQPGMRLKDPTAPYGQPAQAGQPIQRFIQQPSPVMRRGAGGMSPADQDIARQMVQSQPKKKGGMFSGGGKGWDALAMISGTLRDLDGTMGRQNYAQAVQNIQGRRAQDEAKAKQAQQQAAMEQMLQGMTPEQRMAYQANPDAFGKAYSDSLFRDKNPVVVGENSRLADLEGNVLLGATPKPEPLPSYGTVNTVDGVIAFNENNPEDVRRLGAAPVKSPLVVNNLPSEKGETEFQKGRGAAASDAMTGIMDRATVAQSTLADAGMMKTLLKQVDYTGFGGNTLLSVQRMAQSLGFEVEGLGAKEAVSRLTSKLGLALKSDLPGPMSDGDRQFLLDIPPNLATTKEGNAALVFMMTKRAEADIAMEQSLLAANPQTKEEYEAWENEYRRTTPPLFSETTKRKLLAAIGK